MVAPLWMVEPRVPHLRLRTQEEIPRFVQFHPGRRLVSPFHSPRDSCTSTNCPGHPLPPFPSSFHGSLPLFPKAQHDPGQKTTNSSANSPGRISLIHPRRHFLRVSASASHMSQSGRRGQPEGGRDTEEVQIQVGGLQAIATAPQSSHAGNVTR